MGGGVHDSYTFHFQCGLVGSFTSPGPGMDLLYLSSVKVCHVAGRRDAGSESLWLMYDPPMCCISGAIFPLNEFTVVHDTASTGKAFQLWTTLWLKEYLRQSRRAPFL